ncbi:Guanylate kinase [Desulfonema limicola]|uniref:Guanylate kinase n=1 Tax=Desulfonema limicola TaxID=45656 RepID=A0A975B970_9BACT|nr:guanylate kinase [Desulfonema limicola]QTA80972.1 Guanylate kinase [Desulfonema limicola]
MSFNKGILFIVSAPSGAGKTTICQAVLNNIKDMHYSISYTTRNPRGNEKNGVEYFFITKEEFLKGIESGKWAEWAEVHGNYYGTSSETLNQVLDAGKNIILDIDVQGTYKILEKYPDAVTIFIMPPDFNTLRIRMESRAADSPEVIDRRMKNAINEIAQKDNYSHIIVNDDLDKAVSQLTSIIKSCCINS